MLLNSARYAYIASTIRTTRKNTSIGLCSSRFWSVFYKERAILKMFLLFLISYAIGWNGPYPRKACMHRIYYDFACQKKRSSVAQRGINSAQGWPVNYQELFQPDDWCWWNFALNFLQCFCIEWISQHYHRRSNSSYICHHNNFASIETTYIK